MGDLPLITKILVNGGIAAIVLIFVTVLIRQLTSFVKVMKPALATSGGNGGREFKMTRQEIEAHAIHFKNTESILEGTKESIRRAEAMQLCLQNLGSKIDTTNGLLKELVEFQREDRGG
jgi:hypothetical protein